MGHFVEDLRAEADEAIAIMQRAAREARLIHARAELMRHMLTTARKVKDRPRGEAVDAVVGEWMAAWHLDRTAWPHVAREMEAFTEAFHDYVNDPSDAQDEILRKATQSLEDALARQNTSIADQMAWRSQCAHGWWEWVAPVPADLPGRAERPTVPQPERGKPFWEAGCSPFCR